MCGRFTLRTAPGDIARRFQLDFLPDLAPRCNIAPTQAVAVVRRQADPPRRELVLMHWGLIPSWADDPSIGNRMINARSETVASKPAFRSAFKSRRCAIVADGFYEWQRQPGRKQPFHIHLRDGRPFAFAGLWEQWKRDEQSIESCTIITTDCNDLVRPIHDRMPVILAAQDLDAWLDPSNRDADQLQTLLRPYPAAEMSADPVGTLVNNPRNESPDCIAQN